MNIADRATPCARAPLTGAELGRRTFMALQRISRCSIRKDAERTKGENREDAKHGEVFPRPRLITAQTPDQGAAGHRPASPNDGGTPSQWQGHMARRKRPPLPSLRSNPPAKRCWDRHSAKWNGPYPSARPIRVEGMSHEDADAEQDTRCRDDLGHSFPPGPMAKSSTG